MNIKQYNWESIFLKYMMVFGVILLFAIPPFQVPDETVHYYNAVGFAQGDFFPEYKEGTYIGREFPQAIIDYAEYWDQLDHAKSGEDRADVIRLLDYAWGDNVDFSHKVFKGYWASNTSMVGYVFSGFGMIVCRLIFRVLGFRISPYNLMLCGRLSNLMFYIAAVYYAIRISPIYKKTMIVLAMMPMCLYQSTTLSYDAILLPACFLLFALVLKYVSEGERRVSKTDFFLMCLVSLILFNVKSVYAPLLLGLAFIPKEKFGGQRRYIAAGIMIVLCGMMVFLANRMLLQMSIKGFRNEYAPARKAQSQYLMTHIFYFWRIIFNSIMTYKRHYLFGFIGNLGIFKLLLPPIVLLFYELLIPLIMIWESNCGKVMSVYQKVLLGLMGILAIYASFAGIYISWTSIQKGIGVDLVDGMQGRYFIPLAIFLPLLLTHKRWNVLVDKKVGDAMDYLVLYAVTIVPIITILFVIVRFWSL